MKGSYYANTDLKGNVALVRTDPTVDFRWEEGTPAPAIPANQFSVRWTGKVEAPVTGAYTFFTRSDDGVRLWINGKLLINHWNDHSAAFDQSVPVTLTAGQKVDVQLEYYEDKGNSVIQLRWSHPNQAEQVIPRIRLYPGDITLQPTPPVVSRVWLSDLPFLSATNGWGPPERDRSNGERDDDDGKTLTIAGRRYSDGLGVHARSEVKVALDDRYDMFRSIIGVDDEVGNNGSVIFEVWLDGRRAYQSPVMRGNMPGLAIEVPVENAREMTLIVTDAGDGIGSDHADWAEARLEGVEQVKYLSDLNWVTATNGNGPVERDRANGGASAGDGPRLRLAGQSYRKGLGTQAVSEIKYKLDRKYELFSAVLGVDDSAAGPGSVIFEVWTGATRVFRSPKMSRGDVVRHVSVSVMNVDELTLKVLNNGDGNTNDLGDWADAKLLPIGSDGNAPTAPTGLTATPGSGQVELTWNPTAGASTYSVYRGTAANGESTTPIAANLTAATYKNTGLTNGTKYFYKVKAFNGAGASGYSNQASATPVAAPPTPPAPPTGLTATPGNTSVRLNWTAVSGATSYNVYRGTAAGAEATTPIATNITQPAYNNTGLTNGTAYFYKVAAVNAGGVSGLSNEANATPQAPLTAPANLTATGGDTLITLNWAAVPGAASYNVYRGTAAGAESTTPVATNVTATTFVNNGLTNGTKYFYKVAAANGATVGPLSNEASATPAVTLSAPTNLSAAPGNARITLTWTAVSGAVSYNVYRGTAAGGESATPIATNITAATYLNTGLTNGTSYFYRVAAVNAGGVGPQSAEATATPLAAPSAPTGLTVTEGNATVTLNWTPVANAATYSVYRGTTSNGQGTTAIATGLTAPPFVNNGLTNGTTYFYKVTAVNVGGESARSSEISALPLAPPLDPDPATISAWRLLRQATWGPKPGDVDRVKQIGRAAFLTEQFNAPVSVYPDTLYTMPVEMTQEHFMRLALTGPDQLRQRVAWALHKIWVVSAVEIDNAKAIVTYKRVLLNGAFGNYRDLMRDVTLNPAMGRYLNMLNNKAQSVTNALPNENYARELMQLFSLGLVKLGPDGTPLRDALNQTIPSYTEDDVKELARVFTGWTFGDGNPATIPNNTASENYGVPMEAVERFHDTGAKTILGTAFPPGRTTRAELDAALDLIFNNPNVGPFVSRQLIQMLVTSNPSAAYIGAVAAVFNNNGSGVRGDLRAVVAAIFNHPEANLGTATAGKLMEPALFVVSQARSLNAAVVDHPFMTDLAEEMGQKVFYPGSVFSYFSPGYRIRGTTLGGPEFQILTSVTALTRVNFVARLIGGGFGADVTIDFTPFTSKAADPAALVDYCNLLLMGGQMSVQQRSEIISAVRVTPATNTTERARTALYLTLAGAQYQVDK